MKPSNKKRLIKLGVIGVVLLLLPRRSSQQESTEQTKKHDNINQQRNKQ